MKNIKFLNILVLFLFLNACGLAREGFQNPKKNNADEFLVEKKSPLVVPPEFGELPIPNKKKNDTDQNQNTLKELLSNNEQEEDDNDTNNQNLSEALLDKIKRN